MAAHRSIVAAAAWALLCGAAPVAVMVYEGVSWAGLSGRPIRLRASYDDDVKTATLRRPLWCTKWATG